jgi:hypothetical protein
MDNYIARALEGEVVAVTKAVPSTRNHSLNRSAFKLGTIPGLSGDTAVSALMRAAGANGYVKEHGEAATRKVIERGLRAGQRNPRTIAPAHASIRPFASESVARQEAVGSVDADSHCATLPSRTLQNKSGKPAFGKWGEGGPPKRHYERRRHIYTVDNMSVRIKILDHGKGGATWYRVVDFDGGTGWQAAKPDAYRDVAYTAGVDPHNREVQDDDIYCPEGEKDVDTCVRMGLLAATFGGTGDGTPATFAFYFAGRNVVVLSDNDQGGREHAEKKAALLAPVARSVRVVHFPDVPKKGDISDWIAAGHTVEDLLNRVNATPFVSPPAAARTSPAPTLPPSLDVVCMADIRPTSIEYLWPNWLAIGKVHVLAGEGGLGKTTLLHDWTARTTTGDQWPNGSRGCIPGGVLILASEDDVEDTIAPRLTAASAFRLIWRSWKLKSKAVRTFGL